MRYFGLVSAVALSIAVLAPSQAAAQHTSGAGTPMGDLMDLNRFVTRGFMNQWAATRPAALSGLSQASRRWIKAEVKRQAETPRRPVEVAVTLDEVLARDIRLMARSERIPPEEISGAVLLKIMQDTRNALTREARRAGGVAQPGQKPWGQRIAEADTNLRESIELTSSVSLALARD